MQIFFDVVARGMPCRRAMYFALLIHLLWLLAAVPVVACQHRHPASAAAWIAVIGLLPLVGTLLYLLAGCRRRIRCPNRPERIAGFLFDDRLERIIHAGCGTRTTPHNHVELLHNGNNAFTALIAALQRAARTIHMEYYIFRDDRIGRTIADILIRKARAGLEVRVIYDDIGSMGKLRAGRRFVRHEPGAAPPHGRCQYRHPAVRTAAISVVHAPQHPPQPPQNSRYGRTGGISGRHKYCEILPRWRWHGKMAR